jgi:hypothetical protein
VLRAWASSHTAVKTKVRSRTSIEILNGLLRIKCVYPAELVKAAGGSPAEESRKAFLGAVTAAYQQRAPRLTVKLHAGAEALQAPATDVEEGSEDNERQCSIAVSLDALEGCEEEIMSEEEDWDFVFQPACVSESLEGVQGGGQSLLRGVWSTTRSSWRRYCRKDRRVACLSSGFIALF